MTGKIVTTHELKARWAYAELDSKRFAARYSGPHLSRLRDEKIKATPFEALDPSDHATLVELLYGARNADFVNAANAAREYCAETWSKAQLTRTFVVTHYGDGRFAPYAEFYFGAPRKRPDGSPDPDDARLKARNVPSGALPDGLERLIFVRHQGLLVLLEGYLRSILLMRSDDPEIAIPVWAPRA